MNGRRVRTQPLDPDFLLLAYSRGYFPMADARDGQIGWYSPDPRGIIPMDGFSVPRSVRRRMQQGLFAVRCDTAFAEVIACCADRDETWISKEIIDVYTELHRRGHAHSVETWEGQRLVGGLYGVSLGGAFFGESMFSRVTDASKIALISLVGHLQRRGFVLLDTQYVTDHLRQFGAVEVGRRDYLARLGRALRVCADW